MKNELRTIASNQGRNIIKGYAEDNGVPAVGAMCESCEKETAILIDYSGGASCGKCEVHNLRECQSRWGTVVDFAFQGLKYDNYNTSNTRPRVDSVMRDGVWAGINAEIFNLTIDSLIKAGK